MRLRPLFRRNDPTVRTSCDGGEFAIQAIAAGLARRGAPEGIDRAGRAGLLARLTQRDHLSEPDAEHWIGRWEHAAAAQGVERSPAFWDAGWDWIAQQLPPAD